MNTTASLPHSTAFYTDLPAKGVLGQRWAYHSLFWIVLSLYNILYFGFLLNNYTQAVFEYSVKFPFYFILVYGNIYYLIPRFLLTGKYIEYFVFLVLSTLLSVAIIQTLINHLILIDYCPVGYRPKALFEPKPTAKRMFDTFSVLGVTSGIKLTKDWIDNQEKIKELEGQSVKNELEFLKSQIQPHFFFNTLNNLYSLTIKKSDLAPEVVVKLSGLMSYMLYESDSHETTLKKEIEHIQNYLDLESLRFGKRLKLNFEIEGSIEQRKLPPLLLLPFIENAFKHGTSHETGILDLKITLKILNNNLLFVVENPRFENITNRKKHKGLGLKNVQRRLALLYGNNYELNIDPTEKQYVISLFIPLK